MTDVVDGPRVVLDERQQRMLALVRAGQVKLSQELDRIPSGLAAADTPLTSDQARVWFFVRAFPQSAEYNQPVTLRYRACPDAAVLTEALATMTARHDALRLRVFERDGAPMQALQTDAVIPLSVHDLGGLSPGQAETRSRLIADATLQERFEPSTAPLARAALIQMPGGGGIVVLAIHHLIADGRSIEILTAELVALLADRSCAPAPEARFIDYAAWRAARGGEEGSARSRAYWSEILSGQLPVLDIPSDRPRPEVPDRRGATAPIRIPAETVARLREVAEAAGATVFMALLAAYKILLMRLSGQSDVIVGTPLLGRDRPELESAVGMFVNTVPLRTDLSGPIDFNALLARVRDTVIGAQDHSDVPFERIVADVRAPRDLGRSPLFQTMFGFGGLPSTMGVDPAINEMPVDSGAAKWDLTLFLDNDGAGVGGQLEYATALFDADTARRFAAMYERLCARLAAAPDAPIARVPLLADDERAHILHDLNAYVAPPDRYATMAQPFEEQARRAPDRIAIEATDGRRLTYAELDAAANRLAHWLADQGVGPGDRVGVCMQRSPELIVAIYAVAKAGAAYVPLDPDLPDGRIAFMIEDIAPRLVFVHEPTRARLAAACVSFADLDDPDPPWVAFPDIAPACAASPELPVHYLYTSGTTGRPKAVVYPIKAALAEIFWLHGRYPSLGPGDTNLFLTSYGFDVSIWEIFWTLYFGARLVIPDPGDHRDPRRIAILTRRYGATTLFLIPGLLDAVLDEPDFTAAADLRWVFCGGAPVGARLRDRFYERRPSTILINCYGPTEAGAVTDMALPRDPGNPVTPLGRPAANYRLYVLDGNLEPCPIGVPGEVYLAGKVGVGICYHRRAAMTAAKFLPDPFGEPGARMYRTGDLCRYRPDGVLEHLGRADRQAKVRGMRIEPAEIEAVLCEHPAVAQCHVLVLDSQGRAGQLPAFVALRPGATATGAELRAHAARLLPRHMVPTAVVVLEEIPTNVNNKVDQAALAGLVGTAAEDEVGFVPPETAEEAALLEIFQEVVGYPEAGVEHDFFAVGGHSLLIFRLVARCESRLGWRPEVVDIFTAPTVRGLARLMAERGDGGVRCLAPLAPAAGRPLLVLVHPAGGSVLPFMALAQALKGDFSVWGLQSPDSILAADWSVETLAAAYVRAVDAQRDLSPVILAGWSMGGCVALEMARIWQRSGAAPAAVVLLDTWVPPMTLAERERTRLSAALHALDVLGREAGDAADLAVDAAVLDRMAEICRRNVEAFVVYQPAPLDLEIDYLRARDAIADPNEDFADALGAAPDRGWGRFAHAVEVEVVDGDHFSMVGPAHASAMAATLRAIAARRLAAEEI